MSALALFQPQLGEINLSKLPLAAPFQASNGISTHFLDAVMYV